MIESGGRGGGPGGRDGDVGRHEAPAETGDATTSAGPAGPAAGTWEESLRSLLGHFPVQEMAGYGPGALLGVVVAAHRAVDALQAMSAVALAGFSRARLVESRDVLDELMAQGTAEADTQLRQWDGTEEVAVALGLAPGTATRLADTCARLLRLPQTLALLAAGRLHWASVAAIVHETALVEDPDLLSQVEDRIFDPMHRDQNLRFTTRQLERRARAGVAAVDPEAVRRRRERAADDRRVRIEPLADGMARLIADGPAEAIQIIYSAISQIADTLTWNPDTTHRHDTHAGRAGENPDGNAREAGSGPSAGDGDTRSTDPAQTSDTGDADPSRRPPANAGGDHTDTGSDDTDAENAGSDDTDADSTDAGNTGGNRTGPAGDGGACRPHDAREASLHEDVSLGGDVSLDPGGSGRDGRRGWLAAMVGGLPAWFGQVTNPACRFSAGRARFDSLRLLAEAALADPDGVLISHHHGSAPTTAVNITIPLDVLLGLRDDPADLPGHGPLPPVVARMMATDAVLRRIITDPLTGVALDTSTTAYRASPAMRRLLFRMHDTCTYPGCTVPAHRCDTDHAEPWPSGQTTVRNQHPVCRHHHLIKTHQPGWHVHRDHDTLRMQWTTPTGHTGHTYPDRYQYQRPQPGDRDTGQADTGQSAAGQTDTGETDTGQTDAGQVDSMIAAWPDPAQTLPRTATRAPGQTFDPYQADDLARLQRTVQPPAEPIDPLADYPDDPPF